MIKSPSLLNAELLDRHFPRYDQFSPQVPAWCLTPDQPGCIHRFFDTSPFSPSGRYVAVFQLPFEDRQPRPGEAGRIWIIDLRNGQTRAVGESRGWETQMGANLNWGGTDRELFYNDVDLDDWQPFAWKLDPLSGRRQRLRGTVYHASPDGRKLVSANMTTMAKTQTGYGVLIPRERVRWNLGAVDNDGFYMTDTATGETRLFISIAELLQRARPALSIPDPENYEFYGFHSKFNQRGDRVMLSLRWFPKAAAPRWDIYSHHGDLRRYAWFVVDPDKSFVYCPAGPELWDRGGHHATWFPDGRHISMNLNIDGDSMRFVRVREDGSGLARMDDKIIGSGHPTVHPDGRHILTDTYMAENCSYGDGTVPLRWIDLATSETRNLIRVNVREPTSERALRVDPHPAWDRSWRFVAFNGFVDGSRRVFAAQITD